MARVDPATARRMPAANVSSCAQSQDPPEPGRSKEPCQATGVPRSNVPRMRSAITAPDERRIS